MKRSNLNRIVDTLAFMGFVLVASTGVLLRYLLPPGSGRLQGIGTGHQAAEKPITLLWGLTRHAWGEVHIWVAFGLMVVLAVHLGLHWRWVVGAVRGRPREGSGSRVALGVVGLAILLAIGAAPFLSPTVRVPRAQRSGAAMVPQSALPMESKTARGHGAMTLRELASITGVPVTTLVEQLGLPRHISPDERLARVRRLYGVTIEDIRRVVTAYNK
jgi:hypothetical protein